LVTKGRPDSAWTSSPAERLEVSSTRGPPAPVIWSATSMPFPSGSSTSSSTNSGRDRRTATTALAASAASPITW
jgi:hypothetical protein